MTLSTLLLPSSQGQLNMTGAPVKADGWYGYTDGLHTVAVYIQNFRGKIFIEASLAQQPTEDDWFPIALTPSTPWIQYPKNPAHPTGEMMGDTGVEAFTFKANILWLRARIDRTYIEVTPDEETIATLGIVRKIVLSR